MELSKLTNLELIKLLESATELFRNKKYYSKDYVEKYLGLSVHRSGFYGISRAGKITALERNNLNFDSPEDTTLVIEGYVNLARIPVNTGVGNIVYTGLGVLEVNNVIIYDGRAGSGGGSGTITVQSKDGITIPQTAISGIIVAPDADARVDNIGGNDFLVLHDPYLVPAFSVFGTGFSSTVEVGTTLTGITNFVWTTTNSANVQPASIVIRDLTNAVTLGSGLADDGGEALDVLGPIQKNTEASHTWQIELTNTNAGTATLNRATVWSYLQFYGATVSDPTNSTEVRALPSLRFNNAGNSFILNTGNTAVKFAVALPPGKTITQVIDLDALNANITANYVNTGTVTVVDAGGNNVSYTLYVFTQAVPYSFNHRHSITLS